MEESDLPLYHFIDDSSTINQRITLQDAHYTKGIDTVRHAVRYVLLKVEHGGHIQRLEFWQSVRPGDWQTVAFQYPDGSRLELSEEAADIRDATMIIVEYNQKMLLF